MRTKDVEKAIAAQQDAALAVRARRAELQAPRSEPPCAVKRTDVVWCTLTLWKRLVPLLAQTHFSSL